MSDPVPGILAGTFVISGTISAYYLVRGLREGRFGRRITFRMPQQPFRDGREPGYVYRSHSPIDFWMEAGMQIMAVLACFVALGILMMVT